jgi:hypothetical protein
LRRDNKRKCDEEAWRFHTAGNISPLANCHAKDAP